MMTGRNTEGKDKAAATEHFKHLVADQTAKQEVDPVLAVADHAGYRVGHADQDIATNRNIENKRPQTGLNCERTDNGTHVDCLAIAGEQHRDKDERRHPYQTHEQIHYYLPLVAPGLLASCYQTQLIKGSALY